MGTSDIEFVYLYTRTLRNHSRSSANPSTNRTLALRLSPYAKKTKKRHTHDSARRDFAHTKNATDTRPKTPFAHTHTHKDEPHSGSLL